MPTLGQRGHGRDSGRMVEFREGGWFYNDRRGGRVIDANDVAEVAKRIVENLDTHEPGPIEARAAELQAIDALRQSAAELSAGQVGGFIERCRQTSADALEMLLHSEDVYRMIPDGQEAACLRAIEDIIAAKRAQSKEKVTEAWELEQFGAVVKPDVPFARYSHADPWEGMSGVKPLKPMGIEHRQAIWNGLASQKPLVEECELMVKQIGLEVEHLLAIRDRKLKVLAFLEGFEKPVHKWARMTPAGWIGRTFSSAPLWYSRNVSPAWPPRNEKDLAKLAEKVVDVAAFLKLQKTWEGVGQCPFNVRDQEPIYRIVGEAK